MGYHVRTIKKGELGKPSKIIEEVEELEDALEQGNKVLALCELADIYGALEAVVETVGGVTMADIIKMAEATKSAFLDGSRSSSINTPTQYYHPHDLSDNYDAAHDFELCFSSRGEIRQSRIASIIGRYDMSNLKMIAAQQFTKRGNGDRLVLFNAMLYTYKQNHKCDEIEFDLSTNAYTWAV